MNNKQLIDQKLAEYRTFLSDLSDKVQQLQTAQTDLRHLPLFARIMGQQFDIDVKFIEKGIGATDGKTLWLSSKIRNVGGDLAKIILEGVVMHEGPGHIKQTDFSVKRTEHALTDHIENILEDIRIERNLLAWYRGASVTLSETVETLQGLGFFGAIKAETADELYQNPLSVLTGALLCGLRHQELRQESLSLIAEIYQLAASDLFGDLFAEIYKMALAGTYCQNTKDVQAVAIAIVKKLIDEMEQPPQLPPPPPPSEEGETSPDSGEGENSPDQDGSSQSSQKEEPESGEGGADQDSAEQDENSDATGDSSSASGNSSEQGGRSEAGSESAEGQGNAADNEGASSAQGSGSALGGQGGEVAPQDILAEIAAATTASLGDGDIMQALVQAVEQELCARKPQQDPEGSSVVAGGTAYPLLSLPEMEKTALELVGSLDTKLEALLEAKLDDNVWITRTGQLSQRHLSRLSVGDTRIFRRRDEVEGLSTALILVGDVSYSMKDDMDGMTLSMTQAAALFSVGETLQRFDVPFAVMQFSDHAYLQSDFGCWRTKKSNVQPLAISGTNTGNALVKAIEMLAYREEDRKMVLLVTDGQPSSVEDVQAAIHEAKLCGVEVACLMLGNNFNGDFVNLFHGKAAVARTKNEITEGVFAAVRDAF